MVEKKGVRVSIELRKEALNQKAEDLQKEYKIKSGIVTQNYATLFCYY